MPKQYQAEFLNFKNELSSFIFRLLTNKQDTYIKTLEKLDTFKKKSSFKT